MVTALRPWTVVLSAYLDLPFLLRSSGEPVVTCRSAREALDWLRRSCPESLVVDTDCHGAEQVLLFAATHCPALHIEIHEQAIDRLLAS